jgi:hypothetical protein
MDWQCDDGLFDSKIWSDLICDGMVMECVEVEDGERVSRVSHFRGECTIQFSLSEGNKYIAYRFSCMYLDI